MFVCERKRSHHRTRCVIHPSVLNCTCYQTAVVQLGWSTLCGDKCRVTDQRPPAFTTDVTCWLVAVRNCPWLPVFKRKKILSLLLPCSDSNPECTPLASFLRPSSGRQRNVRGNILSDSPLTSPEVSFSNNICVEYVTSSTLSYFIPTACESLWTFRHTLRWCDVSPQCSVFNGSRVDVVDARRWRTSVVSFVVVVVVVAMCCPVKQTRYPSARPQPLRHDPLPARHGRRNPPQSPARHG